MNFYQKLKNIVYGKNINDKLIPINIHEYLFTLKNNDTRPQFVIPSMPVRNFNNLHQKNVKFPKVTSLIKDENKAIALHFFANHELLAIEIMATCLLLFPDTTEYISFKKGIIQTLSDEQKHFNLYVTQMNQYGMEFGDIKYNFYFWNFINEFKTPSEYSAIMSMTLEAANLDFAQYYKNQFESIDDFKISSILNTVLVDEISHVHLGVNYLHRKAKEIKKDLWSYYQEFLPFPLTPAKSKGTKFFSDLRLKSGLKNDFIYNLENYHGEFNIAIRKGWSNNNNESKRKNIKS
jgi:uncharacterized ferritin-like protein (DUF455 family)